MRILIARRRRLRTIHLPMVRTIQSLSPSSLPHERASRTKSPSTGATLINPADGTENRQRRALDRGRPKSPRSARRISQNSRRSPQPIDCRGKFILPGYIDTHVHFFQSGDLFARPDVVDLTSVRPYKDEIAVGQGAPRRHLHPLSAERDHERDRCGRADVEFRGAQKRGCDSSRRPGWRWPARSFRAWRARSSTSAIRRS